MAQSLRYEFIEAEAFFPFFLKNVRKIFKGNELTDVERLYSAAEIEKASALKKAFNTIGLFLVAYDGDKIIGWSFGEQQQKTTFYMTNSAVFPEYRRKGVYTELMKRMVMRLTEMGFQKIYSRHQFANNSVIIAKLKFGFMIGGMETSDRFGSLVRLNYFPNSNRRRLFLDRIRAEDLPSDLRALLAADPGN
jgi:GNAT superfamily N-acetyltransferase